MPLPPKGDPQRPLRLAVRSTRFLGILFIGLGMCGTMPMVWAGMRGGPAAGFGVMAVIVLSTVLIYFGPGSLYLMCSVFIARRRTWAVITALALVGIHLLFMSVGLGALLVAFFSGSSHFDDAFLLIPAAVVLLVLIALAQLAYHLSKCFEAIRQAPLDVQRGFEPLPAVVLAQLSPGEAHGPSTPG